MKQNILIVQRADGSYMKVKFVEVHVEYVNSDGSPRLNSEGVADTGNYCERISEEILAQFPRDTIAGLAQIYDASLGAQRGGETIAN